MEQGLSVVTSSIESKMVRYQDCERRLKLYHKIFLLCSVIFMLAGFMYPAIYMIVVKYNNIPEYAFYYGYFLIFFSVVFYLTLQLMFPKDRLVETSILNNKISSLYDDYAIKQIATWELKEGVDELIDCYIKNSKNIFFMNNRY